MVTLSLTTRAPETPGTDALKVTPKSWRLISVVAEKPARVPPETSGPTLLASWAASQGQSASSAIVEH